jgi:hypothetical protein
MSINIPPKKPVKSPEVLPLIYPTMQVNISTRFGVIPPMLKIPANKVHCNTYKSIIDIKHIIKRLKIPHLYF